MATAIVTGASRGIGLEVARLFARDQHDVVLVARNEAALRAVAEDLTRQHGVRAWPVIADLGTPDGAPLVLRAINRLGLGDRITGLVNNAGFGLRGRFSETSIERELEMIQLNISALTHLTKLLLPGMLSRRAGRILNVASTAAFQPGPLMSVYYASKAYVLSFSLALSVELEGTGVTSTVLCPGPTATGFQAAAGMGGTALASSLVVMDAAAVARAGYRAMQRGKPIVTPGNLNRIVAFATRLVPRMTAARIAKKSQELRTAGRLDG